jgi:hypothetical protein
VISLGNAPAPLTVTVSPDTDFVAELTSDPVFADGTALALQFLNDGEVLITWGVTVSDGSATWYVPAAQVAELINSSGRDARLIETAVGTSQVWAKGTVRVL